MNQLVPSDVIIWWELCMLCAPYSNTSFTKNVSYTKHRHVPLILNITFFIDLDFDECHLLLMVDSTFCEQTSKYHIWLGGSHSSCQSLSCSLSMQCFSGTTGLVRSFPCHFQLKSSSSNLVCRILLAQYHGAWKQTTPAKLCQFLKKCLYMCISFHCNGWQEQKRGREDSKSLPGLVWKNNYWSVRWSVGSHKRIDLLSKRKMYPRN